MYLRKSAEPAFFSQTILVTGQVTNKESRGQDSGVGGQGFSVNSLLNTECLFADILIISKQTLTSDP